MGHHPEHRVDGSDPAGADAGGGAGSYRARVEASAAAGRKLARHNRELHRSYWHTHDLAMADGDLDRKTKELIGLALVVSMQCDVCVSFHVRDCLEAGATEGEIYDALNVVVMQGSGPAMVYAGYAVEALEEYLAEREASERGDDEVVDEPERSGADDPVDVDEPALAGDPPADGEQVEHQVEQ